MNDIAGITQQRTSGDIQRTLLVLAGWFFVAVWLGVSGALRAHGGPPLGIGAAIVLPLIAFALDRRFGSPVLGGFQRLDLPALIGLQTFRIVGVIFIVAWLGGTLPGGFALPAGIGDVAIGLAAPFVATAVADRRPHHARRAGADLERPRRGRPDHGGRERGPARPLADRPPRRGRSRPTGWPPTR